MYRSCSVVQTSRINLIMSRRARPGCETGPESDPFRRAKVIGLVDQLYRCAQQRGKVIEETNTSRSLKTYLFRKAAALSVSSMAVTTGSKRVTSVVVKWATLSGRHVRRAVQTGVLVPKANAKAGR